MKTITAISIFAACAFALTATSAIAQGQGRQSGGKAEPPQRAQVERGQREMDRDRLQDRDRINEPQQDRDRDQDRTNAPEQAKFGDSEIYGQELMSVQEQNQYREQLRLVESDPQAQTKFKAQHEEQMRIRAQKEGVTLKEPEKNNGKEDGDQE